jgi:hypothetical protein
MYIFPPRGFPFTPLEWTKFARNNGFTCMVGEVHDDDNRDHEFPSDQRVSEVLRA